MSNKIIGKVLLSLIITCSPTHVFSAFETDAIQLDSSDADIIKKAGITTTEGSIVVNKESGTVQSTNNGITSATSIKIQQKYGHVVAKKNVEANDGSITLSSFKAKLESTNKSITAKNNITLSGDQAEVGALKDITATSGAITISADDCLVEADTGKITANGSICTTVDGTDSMIKADNDIKCESIITTSGARSSIISLSGDVHAGENSRVLAFGKDSVISATSGYVFGKTIEAKTITARVWKKRVRSQSRGGKAPASRAVVLGSTTAEGTIVADVVEAETVIADSFTYQHIDNASEDSFAAALLYQVKPLLDGN